MRLKVEDKIETRNWLPHDRLSRTLKRKVKGNKDLAVSNLRNEKETRSEISRQRDPGRRVREKSWQTPSFHSLWWVLACDCYFGEAARWRQELEWVSVGNCLAAINLHSIHSLLLPTVLHFQDYKRKKQERNSDKDKEDIDDGCGWSLSSCLVPINNQFFYTSLLRILRLFSFIIFSNRWWILAESERWLGKKISRAVG